MKFSTAVLAVLVIAATTGVVSAQNTLSPADPARPGQQGDDSSKPNGLQNNAGTGQPARTPQDSPKSGNMDSGTMAPSSPGSNARSSDTNVSPASPKAGEQQPAK